MKHYLLPAMILVLAFALVGRTDAASIRWNSDGTKSLTVDGWTWAGTTGDGMTKSKDFSNGQAEAGTDGVWHINDNNSPAAAYMRMYKSPGAISSQGLVMARVKFIAASANIGGTFGYSYASGNHSVVMAIRGNQINWKTAEGETMVPAPVSVDTSSYRVYALRWYSDGSFDAWYSNTTGWSSNQSDWTQAVSGGHVDTGVSQSALVDESSVARTGLLLGSFGTSSVSWEGSVDYIAWSDNSGELQPWSFNPLPSQPDDAQYVSDTIPATMQPSQSYNVAVTMKNIGTNAWTSAGGYKLGAVGDSDPFCAFNRVDLAGGDSIAQNQQKTFSFTMTAPATQGTYTTDWRMIHGSTWFGGTLTKQVNVSALPSFGAQYISDTIPAAMSANQQYSVSVTMKNMGSVTWTQAGQTSLGAYGGSDPFCGLTRVTLAGGDAIATNQQKTFSFTMTAPSASGMYTSDWQMVDDDGGGWFGDVVTKPIQVQSSSGGVVLDDPLQGATSGTRSGGQFVSGGWKVTGQYNYIFWHLPETVSKGAAEFSVTGLNPNECRVGMEDKSELFHMYDYTFNNSDYTYNGGYRENPYKHFIRKTGCLGSYNNTIDSCEVVWGMTTTNPDNWFEADTPVLSWSPSATYRFREEWGPNGAGGSTLRIYRDSVLILERTLAGNYVPPGHSVRIAASNRTATDAGAPIDAIFSYVKAWDLTSYIPSAPTVVLPANGSTQKSDLVFIQWAGDSASQYQVRVCATDNPSANVVWDSGEVASSRNWAWTGALHNLATYYVYVRTGTATGWSGWSASGRWFRVDNSYGGGSDAVRLSGRSFEDADGPHIGLGFTYMAAMWMCRNNRAGFQSDLDFMNDRGFNYMRILSEVPGACSYCYWWNRSTNASTYQCNHGSWASPWPDYDQQLKDCIDIAYDQYGIRTEITVFGGAGESFPSYAGRQAHCQRVLSDLVGREHKIQLIEVANEAWQTGFPGEQGRLDLRSLGQYLADRTSIPVALTAMCTGASDMSPLINLYSGSAADITTEHFDRDLGTSEGHWYPVRDCWRVVDVAGLMPASSNEPIGPGSSVNTEDHPIHVASAAAFAWIANLNSYVYHTSAGVRHDVLFQNMSGVSDLVHLREILPPDVSSWIRNDGKESTSPFIAYCNGQANRYWTDIGGATTGCHRNIGGRKGIEFVCYPQGILAGGLTLEARQQVTFKVYNPLTGAVVVDTTTKNQGEQFILPRGPEAYIIKGAYGPSLPGGGGKTLTSKGQQAALTIDGSGSDWNLSEFTTMIRGGQSGSGDTALVGFDGGDLYYGSYYTGGVLPTSVADHTARIYSRNSSQYLYFLVRCDDSDMRYNNPVGSNWMNDCVEFYIDPGHDGGAVPMSDSTSDIQLVIDANNQRNVYECASGYAGQVLAGVTSAVVRDGTGWWCEVRIAKSVLDPDVPTNNTVGVDFNFRDNDNNNDLGQTTVYNWADTTPGGESKVPVMWGDFFLDAFQAPYSGVIQIPGIIQAENYDLGGQGVSYNDLSSGNAGLAYRSDDVDIESTADAGGGYNIAFVEGGEWTEYTVNVAETGDYSIGLRVASNDAGGSFRVALDGVDLGGVRAFAPTGGWQNWTTIIVPARLLAAGQHVLRLGMETGGWNVNYIDVAGNGADAVSIDMGASNIEDGLSSIAIGDGETTGATIGGHLCRRNLNSADDFYMYFNVSEQYAYQGSKPILSITAEYFDAGSGSIDLHYDATTTQWQNAGGVALTNTNTWKTYTWNLTDAWFGNRQNYGADFRIGGPITSVFYLDTVTVHPVVTDTTAPGQVTGFKALSGDGSNSLSWTNPTDGDFAGVKILAKTTGYPSGPADGSVVYNGTGTSCGHGGLTNGLTYFYAAYTYDEVPNYSTAAQALAAPALGVSIPEAKGLPDNQVRGLRGKIVSAVFPDCFYIQEPGGYSGIKVTPVAAVTVGQGIDVTGRVMGSDAERYVDRMGNAVAEVIPAPEAIEAVVVGGKGLGGGRLNDLAPGVVDGFGANNIGALVTVCGRVTQRKTSVPKWFYIDDGSALRDGTLTGTVENVGVRVDSDPASYAEGSYVVVTGIVSCFPSGGLRPVILPVSIEPVLR